MTKTAGPPKGGQTHKIPPRSIYTKPLRPCFPWGSVRSMENQAESIESKLVALTARLALITRADLPGVEKHARYLTVASGKDVPEEVVWEFHGEAWESLEGVLYRASQVASKEPSEGAWEVLVLDQTQGRLEGVLSLQEGQFSYRPLQVNTG